MMGDNFETINTADPFEISQWEVISVENIIENARQHYDLQDSPNVLREQEKKKGGKWEIKAGIKPVDLYVYLKARFGVPNGLTMLTKDWDDSDNLIHWHYSLRTKSGKIDFICWTFRLEIWQPFYSESESAEAFLLEIKKDFRRMAQAMKAIREGLEKWKMFLNPYMRLKVMIESQLKELEDLDLESVTEPPQPRLPQDVAEFEEAFTEATTKYSKAAQLCLNVRMLAPVWAESFINLLLFILVRPDIRSDRRLYESVLKQNIDVRIRGLHLNCTEFDTHIRFDEWEACKKFHSMMNGRNDMLHGNIDPKLTTFHELYFEEKTPLFIEYKDFAFFSYKASLLNATPQQALDDYQIVQDLSSHILLCLSENAREDFMRLLLARHLGWDEKRKRVGILFPDHMADALFSYSTTE